MKHLLHPLSLLVMMALTATATVKAQSAEPTTVNTQTDRPIRPVLSAWTIGIGSRHLADTYLTPLKYQGWSGSIAYERLQATPWQPERWVMQLKLSADLCRTKNPAGNALMWGAEVHASWGMMRRWNMAHGFSAGIGPALRAEGGCLYNARNGNNPASAKGAVTIDAIAFVANSFSIGRLPVTVRYQPSLPVIGAFFSPQYDQLYYEMYLGNTSGLVHTAWWGTRFKLDNLVTVDLHLGPTSLRLGYECNWMNSRANNITTRNITHRFVIGATVNWTGIKKTKSAIQAL